MAIDLRMGLPRWSHAELSFQNRWEDATVTVRDSSLAGFPKALGECGLQLPGAIQSDTARDLQLIRPDSRAVVFPGPMFRRLADGSNGHAHRKWRMR
ncbi:MAG: hypothetical protein ACC628_01515 [Pirellulaceae bacterium]